MKKVSKIFAMYCIMIGITGNVLELLYFPDVYLIRRVSLGLICFWSVVTITRMLTKGNSSSLKTEYQQELRYFAFEVSATMILIGCFSVGITLMRLFPNSYIRILSFVLIIPPVIYTLKITDYDKKQGTIR